MSKAACLVIVLAYAAEEEAVYRKRKRSIWTRVGKQMRCIGAVVCDIL
jgi:hypothetical protein